MGFDAGEDEWRDECFKLIRLITAMIVEYAPMVKDHNTKAGWAIADLKSINVDLLQATMESREQSAEALIVEGRAVLIELLDVLE